MKERTRVCPHVLECGRLWSACSPRMRPAASGRSSSSPGTAWVSGEGGRLCNVPARPHRLRLSVARFRACASHCMRARLCVPLHARAPVRPIACARLCVPAHEHVRSDERHAGGTLATLCSVDLLLSSSLVKEHTECITCVTFGSSRSFNLAFKKVVDELRHRNRLRALRWAKAPPLGSIWHCAARAGTEHWPV